MRRKPGTLHGLTLLVTITPHLGSARCQHRSTRMNMLLLFWVGRLPVLSYRAGERDLQLQVDSCFAVSRRQRATVASLEALADSSFEIYTQTSCPYAVATRY